MTEFLRESIGAFTEVFPDEVSCLRWLLDTRFGPYTPCKVCGELCAWRPEGSSNEYFRHCCRRIYPRVGSLAAYTSVPLRTWFLVMMLVSNFDGRVSNDFLARHVGLGIKVASRVAHRVRLHMTALMLKDMKPLEGPVYVDEMLLSTVRFPPPQPSQPVIIFGIANNSELRLFCVPDRQALTLKTIIERHVHPGSKIVADGLASYDSLVNYGFSLSRLNHTRAIWRNSAGDSSAPIETVWVGLRRRLEGVHIQIHSKRLWTYLGQHMFIIQCRRKGVTPLWECLKHFPDIWSEEDALRAKIDLR